MLADQAEQIIIEDKTSGLTARRIASALGISVGTFYNVYPSMEDLVGVVNGRTLDRLAAEIEKIDAAGRPTQDVLNDFARCYLDLCG